MSDNKSTQELIEEYIKNGGEVTKLRAATKKDMSKASRKWYHKDRATSGSEKSKEFLDKESKKEATMIFSKVDQWRV